MKEMTVGELIKALKDLNQDALIYQSLDDYSGGIASIVKIDNDYMLTQFNYSDYDFDHEDIRRAFPDNEDIRRAFPDNE